MSPRQIAANADNIEVSAAERRLQAELAREAKKDDQPEHVDLVI